MFRNMDHFELPKYNQTPTDFQGSQDPSASDEGPLGALPQLDKQHLREAKSLAVSDARAAELLESKG